VLKLEQTVQQAEKVARSLDSQIRQEPRISRGRAAMWAAVCLVVALIFASAGAVAGWQYAQSGVGDAAEDYHIAKALLPEAAQWAASKEGRMAFRTWPQSVGKWNLSKWADSDIVERLNWAFTPEATTAYSKSKRQ